MVAPRVGDTVVVGRDDGVVYGLVTEVGVTLRTETWLVFDNGIGRLMYRLIGGLVVVCKDAAGWPFVASIGWTHPDVTLSIRRGVRLAAPRG